MANIYDGTRAKFEEWAKLEGFVLDRYMGSMGYTNNETALAWRGWKQCYREEVLNPLVSNEPITHPNQHAS